MTHRACHSVTLISSPRCYDFGLYLGIGLHTILGLEVHQSGISAVFVLADLAYSLLQLGVAFGAACRDAGLRIRLGIVALIDVLQREQVHPGHSARLFLEHIDLLVYHIRCDMDGTTADGVIDRMLLAELNADDRLVGLGIRFVVIVDIVLFITTDGYFLLVHHVSIVIQFVGFLEVFVLDFTFSTAGAFTASAATINNGDIGGFAI